jgi:hypothetical protein
MRGASKMLLSVMSMGDHPPPPLSEKAQEQIKRRRHPNRRVASLYSILFVCVTLMRQMTSPCIVMFSLFCSVFVTLVTVVNEAHCASDEMKIQLEYVLATKYICSIPRVPQCLSPRWIGTPHPLSRKRVCFPPEPWGGGGGG